MIQLIGINETIIMNLNLTIRQVKILNYIKKYGTASNQELKEYCKDIARITIVRDVNILLEKGLIEKVGNGRNIRYQEKIINELLGYIDVNKYFKKDPDERDLMSENFNFKIFENLGEICSLEEIKKLEEINKKYQTSLNNLPIATYKKEFERLTIEFSWKSSKIEGNTYSLIDTEILIKEHKEAKGHQKSEAIMILNHKKALDYILQNTKEFKKLSLIDIHNVHTLLVKDMDIPTGIRESLVGITSTRYKPLDNKYQIEEAIKKTISHINRLKDPFSKAITAMLLLAYIQPFMDGNKRTSRIIGNALLMAHQACPLSFRNINEADYKKAMILFYEQNNFRFFKELFIEQFEFAVNNYF